MLHQVYCSIDETNVISQQLFLDQGFTLCGHRKDWIRIEERYIDVYEYQRLKVKNHD
jgi:RimJ/RimL family protein N-acetyltransferase